MRLNRITIEQLCNNRPSKVLNYKGKMIVSDHIAQEYLFEEPCRLDAITLLVCIRGQLDYAVNLEQYSVQEEPCILLNMPENIIQFRGSEGLEAYAVLVSTELVESLPYDLLQRAGALLPVKRHLRAQVPVEELRGLIPFMDLLRTALSRPMAETDEVVKSLLQAFLLSVYGLMHAHQKNAEEESVRAIARGTRLLAERFMDLLRRHHQQERMVQYYADRLCVTPKYLSMVVKDFSGRSPSDWISDYVVAEAKSLLHYSQLPPQEVAFRLNFPSTAAFGKFFKLKTGISPRQYVKGE